MAWSGGFSFGTSTASTLPFPMHQRQDRRPIGGGTLRLVTGDLLDGSVCPGPFDAVIERRTLQRVHYATAWLLAAGFDGQADSPCASRLVYTTG